MKREDNSQIYLVSLLLLGWKTVAHTMFQQTRRMKIYFYSKAMRFNHHNPLYLLSPPSHPPSGQPQSSSLPLPQPPPPLPQHPNPHLPPPIKNNKIRAPRPSRYHHRLRRLHRRPQHPPHLLIIRRINRLQTQGPAQEEPAIRQQPVAVDGYVREHDAVGAFKEV